MTFLFAAYSFPHEEVLHRSCAMPAIESPSCTTYLEGSGEGAGAAGGWGMALTGISMFSPSGCGSGR